MKRLVLLLACALVGVTVAFTYFGFEYAVHHSITLIWFTLFNTENNRMLVMPLCVILSFIFFASQHFLDRKSDKSEAHGLGGGTMDARLKNVVIILCVGYLSLVAGASLGPEAVLVPACIVIGAFFGSKLFKDNSQAVNALAAAGIIALFAGFFHSFVIGFLAVFLVSKQAKVALSPQLVAIAVIASASSYFTLKLIDPIHQYFSFPHYRWTVKLTDVGIALALVCAGYFTTFALKASYDVFETIRTTKIVSTWWQRAIIASFGLSLLYIFGGPLVEFTGNLSIAPLYSQAASIGVIGLIWIYVIKLSAIGWSKALGYRGGMVFPIIFVASVLVAIAHLCYAETNYIFALISTMVGVIAAERKANILF
jgi:hypothetical protein